MCVWGEGEGNYFSVYFNFSVFQYEYTVIKFEYRTVMSVVTKSNNKGRDVH